MNPEGLAPVGTSVAAGDNNRDGRTESSGVCGKRCDDPEVDDIGLGKPGGPAGMGGESNRQIAHRAYKITSQ
jgi:hypothetical protein